MKQTAVEWLEQQLYEWLDGRIYLPPDIFEQAKEMEKQQVINSFVECWKENMPDGYECILSAEQHYQETFKKD
jgi:hypothetical protein